MRRLRSFRLWVPAALALAAAVLVAACGGGGEKTPAGTVTPAPSLTAAPAATPGGPAPTESCKPGKGPPKEGLASGLEGRVTYVRLVFGCQPDIYIMNANGDGATALTTDPALDDEADLSPDGKKVVFFSGREGNAYIYVMNADGSGLTKLTGGGGGDTSPRWSPDGKRIAYSHSGSLWVMNADGSDQKMIMQAQDAATAEPCRAGSFVGSWSPDGKRIVYYSAVIGSGRYAFWICAIDADGSNMQVLVDKPEGKLHAEPYWSPDGKKIAFRDDRDGNCSQGGNACNYEIYVLDLETGQETNVTKHPALDIEPAWSPDGQWIMFASNRDDPNFDLYVVHPDGTGLQRVLNDPESKDSYPSWR